MTPLLARRALLRTAVYSTAASPWVVSALASTSTGCAPPPKSPEGGARAPALTATPAPMAAPLAPLDRSVFTARMQRAREVTARAGATWLFAMSGCTNFRYLLGADFWRGERLIALVLPTDAGPFILAPSFEVERVRRAAPGIDVRGWEEQENPLRLLSTLVSARAKGPAAIEPTTPYHTVVDLEPLLGGAKLIDAGPLLDELRVVKSADELVRLERACAVTEDAFAATFAALARGTSDRDVAARVAEEHRRRGTSGSALVQFGPQSSLPHGGTIDARLEDGTPVLIDGGCTVEGYRSDLTRMRWFGDRPSPRYRELYRLVFDAQDAAMARVRPGVPAQEIDRAARAVIERAGFGKYFTHRLGHGIGLDEHEPSYMVEGNTRPLEEGNVFSVEPGIYLPGEFGVRLEDNVVCTAHGARLLSRRAPSPP